LKKVANSRAFNIGKYFSQKEFADAFKLVFFFKKKKSEIRPVALTIYLSEGIS